MSAVDRLLERANAAGRTRLRCRYCERPIALGPVIRGGRARLWLDDDGHAVCRDELGAERWHQPPPAYPAAA